MGRRAGPIGAKAFATTWARGGAALGVVALGVVTFVAAGARRDRREVLEASPSHEAAALAVAADLRRAGERRRAYEVLAACARARPAACACGEEASGDALDVGLYAEARALLEPAPDCPETARRMGLAAEALVGTAATDEGLKEAERALASDPKDPHAAYARAWGATLKGVLPDARRYAREAVALERGNVAHLLLGLIELRSNDLDAAAKELEIVLAADPTSVQATYDMALIAQRRNRYHDAREGYLRTLRLDPTYVDARYNLAVLTFGAGAVEEARHHVEELAARAPGDPRLAELRAMVGTGGQR